jgi:hypothetical protein
MINVSEEFKQNIFKTGRKIHGRVTIFFTNTLRRTFTKKDLFSLRLLERKEFFDGHLSAGNFGSNQLEITFNNTSRMFDLDNETSELYGFLQPGKRVEPFLGLELENGEIEWVTLGVFWSGEWVSAEHSIQCKTLCVDRLELLDRTTYETGKVIPTPAVILRTDDIFGEWLQGSLWNMKATPDGKLTLDLGGET